MFYVFSHGQEVPSWWNDSTYFDGFQTSSGYYQIEELRDDFDAVGREEALVISILDTCGSGQLAQKGKGAANTAWITAIGRCASGYRAMC